MAIFYPSILFVLMFMNSKQTYQSEYRVLTDNCEYWQYQSQFGCQNCSYQCQTCTNFSICTTCLNLNHRQILDNQCNCQQGYFDIINQSTCGQCHSECVDCYGPLRNNCLTCPSPKIKNEYNICYCSSEYYLDQFTNQCELCNINCLICNGPNSNNCLQCDNTKTLVSNECICYDLKLYNDPLTGQCVQCDPNCNQCNGPNSIDCLSCNFGKFLVGSECKCQSNQYETNEFGFVNCVQCHPSCLTCSSNHQNNCQSCPVNSTLDGQNFCVCDGGYFENNYVCEQCDQTCLLCQYNSKYCTQCNAGEYLLFNQCSCSSSKTDATCSIDCADSLCEKCDRFNGSICYQCVIDASLDSGLCTCPNGLYSQSGVCNVCPSTCITCNSPTECQSCSDGFYGTHCQSNCPANCIACDSPGDCTSCITGFAGNSCSSSCNAKCVGCSILSVTSCAACHVPLVLHGNVCGCPEHFYGGGCNIACLSSCKTCTGSIGCTVCLDETMAPPNCSTCIPTPKMNSNCDCEMGYYLAGTHDCQECDSKCRTCNGTSSNCYDCYNTTPNQHRDLDNYQCLCQTGYLDTGLDQCVIPTCGNACKECMGTVCSECITANTFRYDLPAQNCPCIDGYYEVFQTAICVKCPNKCSSCTFQSLQTTNICLLCEGSNRILHKGCTCMKGYYDNGDNCEICSIGCSECLNSTTCVICQQNYIYTSGSCYCALINYNTSDCQCLAGYYLDLYTYRCLPCQIQCKTCVLTSSNCLECNQSLPLQIRVNPPKCSCGPTFYEKYLKCESCLSKCQECLDRNTCTSCNSVKILEFSQCKCQQSGYFDSPYPPFICQPCDPKCFECEFSAINCTLCSNNRIYEPICYCPPTYYIHFGDNLCEKCNSKCQECYGFETNCSQCGINRSSPPLCNCSTGYYEDLDEICIKCEPQCVDCQDSPNNCLTCSYLRIEPNLCKCLDGQYETTEKQCLPCHSSCQTCLGPNEYNCLSCDDLKNRSQSLYKCPCKNGYFQNDGICVKCTIDIISCQPYICGDGIKLTLEECDDGNLVNRDGCTNQCLLESGYYCENTPNYAIHPLIQMSQCQKCTSYCLECNKERCVKCQSTYYLTEQHMCQICDQHCKECDGPKQSNCLKCVQGFDFGFSKICSFCEENIGFYPGQNTCITKCGDMIFKENYEQCDDGNNLNGDGCSSDCLIEDNFDCTNTPDSLSVCLKIDFPFANLYFNQDYSIYDSIRYGTLTFSKPMIYQSDFQNDWNYSIENYTSFNLSVSILQNQHSELIGLKLDLELLELIYDGILTIDFSQQPIRAIYDNLELKPLIVSSSFGQFYKLSDTQISTTQKTMDTSSIILFIYLGILILGILLQNFDFFWNLLDLLQIISYYSLFNVKFPYIVNQYLTIFSFARMDFLNEIIEFNWINQVDTSIKSDFPFVTNNDLSANLWLNMQSFITVWLFTIFTRYLCQILLISLYYAVFKRIKLSKYNFNSTESLQEWLIYRYYKVIRTLFQFLRSYIQGFPSNYLQVFISTIYDFNLGIFTTIYCSLRYDSFDDNELFFVIMAVILLSIQIIGIYSLIPTITKPHYQLKSFNFRNKYSGLFVGMRLYDLTSRKLAFALVFRRILFISLIVLLYDDPSYQVGVQLCIQLTFFIFAIVMNPFRNKLDKIKNIIIETSLTCSIFLIYVYHIQDQISILSNDHFEYIGYIHIGVYSMMLFANLVLDILAQIQEIIRRNKYLKDLNEKCFPSKKLKQDEQANINRLLFI